MLGPIGCFFFVLGGSGYPLDWVSVPNRFVNHVLMQQGMHPMCYGITHAVNPLGVLRDLCEAGLMWHGTSLRNAMSIQHCAYIQASTDGFFGPGVYLTSSRSKAKAWAHATGERSPTIVRVKVNIGRCKVFDMCQAEDVHVCMKE